MRLPTYIGHKEIKIKEWVMSMIVSQSEYRRVSLSRLFALVFIVALWLSIYRYGRYAGPLALPTVLFSALLLGATLSTLKVTALLVAISGAVTGFYVAARSYPIIITVDSLSGGIRALNHSKDAACFGVLFLGLAILASGVLRRRWAYWGCACSLGALMISVTFSSDTTPESVRWAGIFTLAFTVTLQQIESMHIERAALHPFIQ